MLENHQLFCSRPFQWFEVTQVNEIGEVFVCCPSWLNTPIGNLKHHSVMEVWNSKKAQELRYSILDGSFKYCNRSRCPFLPTISGPVQKIEDIKDDHFRAIINEGLTVLPYGPKEINCSYDKSCNLSCPSCRTEVIIENTYKEQILEVQNKISKEAVKDAQLLYITGSGDPFGSPYFRKWLQTMKRRDMPQLKRLHIHTNAQLWTPKMWKTIPDEIRQCVKTAEISIDAASPGTYSINRRGGSFERLLENMEFISMLHKSLPMEWVGISMVVQENNFREMPDFVRLGKRFNFGVYFSKLVDWGTYPQEEFYRRTVHISTHPKYSELVKLLKDEIFHDPIVCLGNLTELVNK